MNIYSFSCTRDIEKLESSGQILEDYFYKCGIKHKWLSGETSIFEAYSREIKELSPGDNDIIILCHDDIEIWDDPGLFINQLEVVNHPRIGFIGPAGTTYLDRDAVWWEINRRKQGLHSGYVFQGKNRFEWTPNYFGPYRQVVVLDGVFLAASGKTLKSLNLEKPNYFEGEWDFYDIHYTLSAHRKGLMNYARPIMLLHNSPGELVGRDSWTKNRQAFIKHNKLPVKCLGLN